MVETSRKDIETVKCEQCHKNFKRLEGTLIENEEGLRSGNPYIAGHYAMYVQEVYKNNKCPSCGGTDGLASKQLKAIHFGTWDQEK